MYRFSTMEGPFVNNPLEKWIGFIRKETYEAASENIRWAYELVSDFGTYLNPDSDSIADG